MMNVFKDRLCVYLILLGIAVKIIPMGIEGQEYWLLLLLLVGVIPPIYYLVASLLISKRRKNIWFPAIMAVAVFIPSRIFLPVGVMSLISCLFWGYIGYFIGRLMRKKEKRV